MSGLGYGEQENEVEPFSLRRKIKFVREWGPRLGKYAMVQLAVQLVGALAGLLIVRTLSKQEYALYTLASILIPTLCSLAGSGVTYAASALGGQSWEDRRRLGQIAVTAFKVSRIQAVVSAVPVVAIFAWLLHRNGASPTMATILLVAALTAAGFQFASGILTVVPRLKGEFNFLQGTDLSAAGLRLILVAAGAVVWLDAVLATLITALANGLRWLKIRSWARASVDLSTESDPAIGIEMRRVMWRQWLNEVYYVVQGHASLYLLSIFGSAVSVANFGALGRIGSLFALPGAVMQNIVLPRFARCQDPAQLRYLYIQIFSVNALIAAMPVLLCVIIPQPFLWLLGAKYDNLTYELFLYAVNLGLTMLSDTAGGLNAVRAWIIPSWMLAPIWLIAQLCLMAVIGVSSLSQVLWISILTNVVLISVYLYGAVHFGRAFARAVAPAADNNA